MKQIEIYWNDLNAEKQAEIIREIGDDNNWDVFPMATIDIEEDELTSGSGAIGETQRT